MVISHFGLGMVKIQLGERVIVFNPIGRGTDREPLKFGADLALVSLRDEGYAGVTQVSRGERVPFVIDGPGEYEVEGDFVHGFATAGPSGKINTAFLLILDQVRLVHLGALSQPELAPMVLEQIGVVDVLFVPLAPALLGPKGAAKVAKALEAKVVVPVDFDPVSLAAFLKETGEEKLTSLETWTVKRKDLAEQEGKVVVVKSY